MIKKMNPKNYFSTLLLVTMFCAPFATSAQVTIGSGREPSHWSLLDLCTQVQQKALHNARMSENQRNALMSPSHYPPHEQREAKGLLIFNTCENCLEFWNGREWISLCYSKYHDFTTPHPENTAVCYGDTHTFTLDVATSDSGIITYQWQSRLNSNYPWTDITGAVVADFTTESLTADRYFRRIAVNYDRKIVSSPALVTVHPAFTTPHPVNAVICHSTSVAINLDAAVGGSGTLTYQWQRSTNAGASWTDIAGATGQNLTAAQMGNLTATTHFRRNATRSGTDACGGTISSNAAVMTVTDEFTQPNFQPTRDWTVQGATYTIRLGAAAGGSGTLTYQWQSSADGTSDWTDIAGAVNENFTTQAFQAGSHRFFRRQATRTVCGDTITSNVFQLTVIATHNVAAPGAFAANPENTGMLYQWNRRVGWSAADPLTSSPAGQDWNSTGASGGEWTQENDPCPVGWRVSRRSDIDFVRDNNSDIQSLTVNGVLVWKITNSQNTQLIFPVVNQVRREANGALHIGIGLGYWLRGYRGISLADAYAVYADGFGRVVGLSRNTARGLPVRCVLQ